MQRSQAVEAGERLGAGHLPAALDDVPGDRQERVRVALQEVLRHEIPLGEPGPVVEQGRRLEKRAEVDPRDLDPEPLETGKRLVEQTGVALVAEELQLLGARGAKAAERPRCFAGGAGERVGGVESLDHLKDRGAVVAAERKNRDAVERPAGRHHAARADQPAGRLDAHQLQKPAGTRPEPAVSVPSAKLTRPAATATAEPELEPPAM